MRTSDRGIALIKSFESCRLEAYLDVRGIPTIGWGHTGHSIKPGDTWTQDIADAWLRMDLFYPELAARGFPWLGQNQFDALASLIFNIGYSAFRGSHLRMKLVDKDVAGAADQFLVWDHADGAVVPGLLRRREAERALFLEKEGLHAVPA